jgi:hypothetical protein
VLQAIFKIDPFARPTAEELSIMVDNIPVLLIKPDLTPRAKKISIHSQKHFNPSRDNTITFNDRVSPSNSI